MASYNFQLCPGGGRGVCIDVDTLLPTLGDVIRVSSTGNYYVYNGGGSCASPTLTWDTNGYTSCSDTTQIDISYKYDPCTGGTAIYLATGTTSATVVRINDICYERDGSVTHIQNADYSSIDASYVACSTCQLEVDYTGYTISYIECCTDEVTTSQLVNFPNSGSTPAVNATFQIDGTCYRITNIISTTKPNSAADNASAVTLNDGDCSKCFSKGGNACPTPTPSPSATISTTPTNTPTKTPSISVTQTPSISVTQTPSISPTQTPSISLTPTATPSIRVVNYSAINCCDGTRIYVTISDGPTPAPNVGFINNGECYYFENISATPGTFFVDSSDWIANICNDGACVCPTVTPSASPTVSVSPTQTPSISVTQTPTISTTPNYTGYIFRPCCGGSTIALRVNSSISVGSGTSVF